MAHNVLCLQSFGDIGGSLYLLENIKRFPSVPLLQNVLAYDAAELLQTQMGMTTEQRASVSFAPPCLLSYLLPRPRFFVQCCRAAVHIQALMCSPAAVMVITDTSDSCHWPDMLTLALQSSCTSPLEVVVTTQHTHMQAALMLHAHSMCAQRSGHSEIKAAVSAEACCALHVGCVS